MTEAPLWRLRTAHYLNVPGTEWEHTETSRETGRKARKMFPVPALLDPNDGGDCTRDGDCLVYRVDDETNASRFIGKPGHHEFVGDPTPDMEPMNPAAEAISETFADKWQHPIDSLAPNFSQSLLTDLEGMLAKAINNAGGVPAASTSVASDEVAALRAQVAELTALVQGKVAEASAPAPATTVRR